MKFSLAAICLTAVLLVGCSKSRSPAECRPDMINLNTASAAELALLKGIGPERAADIIAYRSAQSGFKRVADVKKVKGIGEKTYERLRKRLSVTCSAQR